MLRALPLLLLAACAKDPVVEVIPGVSSELEIVLVNPTECGACDPFQGVDTLKVEVTVGDDEVASDSFAWPGEQVILPDISTFGVVRVQLLGLQDGRVISVGRTPEIVLTPDAAQSVEMMFLPANRLLPLALPMMTARSRHAAVPRRDGSVLLVGGQDVFGERALGTSEIWSLDKGFTDGGPITSSGAADPMVATLASGDSFLTGGYAIVSKAQVAVDGSTLWNETDGVFEAVGSLSTGRYGGCFVMFEERKGIALGGGPETADYLKPDDEGAWKFTSLEMLDFEVSQVTGCVAMQDGLVFVQGGDETGTGVWDGLAEQPAQAFAAISPGAAGDFRYVRGASLVSPEPGVAWVFGGADVATGEVLADARLFSADAMRFETLDGFGEPRFDAAVVPWIQDGWYAAGCGWSDADRSEADGSFELIAPAAGEASPLFDTDRARPGCALSVLRDGALLVTGGFDPDEGAGEDAGVLVPYVDPTRSG